MGKIIKNIPAFFLWLAWLIITAHLIIPHDHHLADSFTADENACPVSNGKGKTSHNSGFPVHCHAFNDLTSEKAINYFFSENIQHNDIGISNSFDPFKFDLQLPGITIFNLRKTFTDSYFLKFSALRAPPSLT